MVDIYNKDKGNIEEFLIKNLTPEISHQLMMVINNTKTIGFGKWLTQKYQEMAISIRDQTAKRIANNLIVYILGRLENEIIDDEMWKLLSEEKDDFLRNGLYWSLCSIVGLPAVSKYLEEMNQNDNLSYLNRGYHLYYYSDIDRSKKPPYLDNDRNRNWSNTRLRMLAFMNEANYQSRVSLGRRVLDFYTFCDLSVFRHERITDKKELEFLSKTFRTISDELNAKTENEIREKLFRKYQNATLCVYNSETTPPNNLECRAEEQMRCLRTQMVV